MVQSTLRRFLLWSIGASLLPPNAYHTLENRLSALEDAHDLLEDRYEKLKCQADEFVGVRR